MFIVLYADDILLLAPSIRELQLLLQTCEAELTYLDMTINVNKNSSGDEIANVNFFYNIVHVEASAYAH